MLEDAADGPEAFLRKPRVLSAGENRLLTLAQGEVQVHAAAVVFMDGLGHKSRGLAEAVGGVADDIFEPHQRVGRIEQRHRARIDLALPAGRDLVVVALDRHAHAAQQVGHVRPQVGQRVIRRVGEVALVAADLVPEIDRALLAALPLALG